METSQRLGNGPTWFVGLGLAEWFRSEGLTNVQEMVCVCGRACVCLGVSMYTFA